MEENTVPQITTRSVGIRYGLIMTAVSIAMFLAFTFTGMDMTSGIGRWSSLVFCAILIFMAQKYFMDNGDGFMSYGQGMGISFWLGSISTVIYSAFFYVYIKFIDGSFVDAVKQKQIEKMQEQGMSDADIDRAMGFASAFMTHESMLIFSLVGGIVGSIIVGLIITIFTQKRTPEIPS